MNYTFINPTFTIHYNQGYTSKAIDYAALYNKAFAQIGERTLNFTPINHHEIFAPLEELKAEVREAGGWDAYWTKQNRATNNLLQSAIGFEPTDSSELHHDMAPFLPQTKPQVCIDFGFEPTEGCE